MKTKYIKQLFSAALIAVLSSGVTSCINDLDISPIDPQEVVSTSREYL